MEVQISVKVEQSLLLFMFFPFLYILITDLVYKIITAPNSIPYNRKYPACEFN